MTQTKWRIKKILKIFPTGFSFVITCLGMKLLLNRNLKNLFAGIFLLASAPLFCIDYGHFSPSENECTEKFQSCLLAGDFNACFPAMVSCLTEILPGIPTKPSECYTADGHLENFEWSFLWFPLVLTSAYVILPATANLTARLINYLKGLDAKKHWVLQKVGAIFSKCWDKNDDGLVNLGELSFDIRQVFGFLSVLPPPYYFYLWVNARYACKAACDQFMADYWFIKLLMDNDDDDDLGYYCFDHDIGVYGH